MASITKVHVNTSPTYWQGKSPIYGIERRCKMPAGLTDQECRLKLEAYLNDLDALEKKIQEKKKYYLEGNEYPMSRIMTYKNKELQNLATQIQQLRNQNSQRFVGGYTGPAIMDAKIETDRINALEAKKKKEIEDKYNGSAECLEMVRKLAIEDEMSSDKLPFRPYQPIDIPSSLTLRPRGFSRTPASVGTAAVSYERLVESFVASQYAEAKANLASDHSVQIVDDQNFTSSLSNNPSQPQQGYGLIGSLRARVGGITAQRALQYGGGFNHPGIYAPGIESTNHIWERAREKARRGGGRGGRGGQGGNKHM